LQEVKALPNRMYFNKHLLIEVFCNNLTLIFMAWLLFLLH